MDPENERFNFDPPPNFIYPNGEGPREFEMLDWQERERQARKWPELNPRYPKGERPIGEPIIMGRFRFASRRRRLIKEAERILWLASREQD